MSDELHGVTHTTSADGNIFVDLGFPPDEAAKLLAETDKAILEKIAINGSAVADSTT